MDDTIDVNLANIIDEEKCSKDVRVGLQKDMQVEAH